jgi:methionine-rich copper-binding protein CopC
MLRARLRVLPLTILLLASAVVGLSAHLKVEKTYPATDGVVTSAPKEVRVWFSQEPTLPVSALTLEGPNGKVALGKVVAGVSDEQPDKSLLAPISGSLAVGEYTVTWKTSGSDGHIQTGTFKFILKTAN